MHARAFDALPDTARLWAYAAERTLSSEEQTYLLSTLSPFFAQWQSHGRRVEGAACFVEDRLLLIAATLTEGEISGCGIDASVRSLQAAGEALGIGWVTGLNILYRDAAGSVQAVSRPAFRQLVRDSAVTANTSVFDLSLTTLAAFRQGQLERRAGDSWHAQVFRIPASVGA